MGYIKEPSGIDFVVEPSVLTEADKVQISAAISHYKRTGEIIKAKDLAKVKKAHNIAYKNRILA